MPVLFSPHPTTRAGFEGQIAHGHLELKFPLSECVATCRGPFEEYFEEKQKQVQGDYRCFASFVRKLLLSTLTCSGAVCVCVCVCVSCPLGVGVDDDGVWVMQVLNDVEDTSE